jgi:molecular chaperone DnaJ
VLVRIEQHEKFERDGEDLMVLVPVNFTQLAMGAEIEVPTLDTPEPHELRVPAGTQNGELFRIPHRGMPDRRSGRIGDLVAVLHLVVPRHLSEAQRDLLKQYAETEDVAVDADSPGFWTRIKEAVRGH